MELVSIYSLILLAGQVGTSWLIKHYTVVNNKLIPWINFASAALIHTVLGMQAGLSFPTALVQGLYKGLITAVASTGLHSAGRSTTELMKARADGSIFRQPPA